MKSFTLRLALVGICALAGCGNSYEGKSAPPPTTMQDNAMLKTRLSGIASTGMLGSALAGVKEAIEKLPADKSAALLKDYEDMVKATPEPDKVKEIAKRMADQL